MAGNGCTKASHILWRDIAVFWWERVCSYFEAGAEGTRWTVCLCRSLAPQTDECTILGSCIFLKRVSTFLYTVLTRHRNIHKQALGSYVLHMLLCERVDDLETGA